MAEVVSYIINVIVLLTLICFGFIISETIVSLTAEAFSRIDKWIKRNADRLFTLDIDFFKKK